MRPRERLLRKDIPKEAIRKELERWSDRLSDWDQFFTAVVFGGLAIEFLPDVASFAGIVSHAVFVVLHTHVENLHAFGGAIVLAGIMGEFCISSRERKVETDLRDESNTEIETIRVRAASAEKDAAEANLARVKIEEALFKPHLLDEKSLLEFAKFLIEYSGRKRVDVFVYDSHIVDVLVLADSINAGFITANWNSKMWVGAEPRIMGTEVTFSIARECPLQTGESHALQELSGRLGFVLSKLGIGSSTSLGGFSTVQSALPSKPLVGWGLWKPSDVAILRVQVGQRQLISTLFSRPVTPSEA